MSKENENTGARQGMTDLEAFNKLKDLLSAVIPNKGDGMEFKTARYPKATKSELISDYACHCLYNAGDGKFMFRDMNHRSYAPVSMLDAGESQELAAAVRKEGVKAVNRYKAGNAMRDAIIERVTTPTARHFTYQQQDSIRRYLGSFADPQERDARASYVWNEAKEAGNFAKHPEKWEKDALSEFNAIKNGFTHGKEESQHARIKL